MTQSTRPISRLRQRMLDDMRLRKLSPATQRNYIRAVVNLTRFLGRSPDTADAEDLRRYQLHMVEHGVTSMTIEDAKGILNGPDDAATTYLRKVGGEQMRQRIAPIVSEATDRTGVTRQYKQLFDKMGFLNQVLDPDDYDIDKYVTGKTMDGLFFMIAEEEKKIRENPVERTTDLLKKVFGS